MVNNRLPEKFIFHYTLYNTPISQKTRLFFPFSHFSRKRRGPQKLRILTSHGQIRFELPKNQAKFVKEKPRNHAI